MATKHDLNKWIFEILLEDIQPEDYEDSGAEHACIACGKRLKNPQWAVHLLTNGNLVSSREDFDNSQGMHPIGADCKNKLPNNFYWRFEFWKP